MQIHLTDGLISSKNSVYHGSRPHLLSYSNRMKVIDREIGLLRDKILKKQAVEQSLKEKSQGGFRLGSFFKVILLGAALIPTGRLFKDLANSSAESTPSDLENSQLIRRNTSYEQPICPELGHTEKSGAGSESCTSNIPTKNDTNWINTTQAAHNVYLTLSEQVCPRYSSDTSQVKNITGDITPPETIGQGFSASTPTPTENEKAGKEEGQIQPELPPIKTIFADKSLISFLFEKSRKMAMEQASKLKNVLPMIGKPPQDPPHKVTISNQTTSYPDDQVSPDSLSQNFAGVGGGLANLSETIGQGFSASTPTSPENISETPAVPAEKNVSSSESRVQENYAYENGGSKKLDNQGNKNSAGIAAFFSRYGINLIEVIAGTIAGTIIVAVNKIWSSFIKNAEGITVKNFPNDKEAEINNVFNFIKTKMTEKKTKRFFVWLQKTKEQFNYSIGLFNLYDMRRTDIYKDQEDFFYEKDLKQLYTVKINDDQLFFCETWTGNMRGQSKSYYDKLNLGNVYVVLGKKNGKLQMKHRDNTVISFKSKSAEYFLEKLQETASLLNKNELAYENHPTKTQYW